MTRSSLDKCPIPQMTLWTTVISGRCGPGMPRGRIPWWADPAAATSVAMSEPALPPRGRVCLHTHSLSVPLAEAMGLGDQPKTKGEDPETLCAGCGSPQNPSGPGQGLLSLDRPPPGLPVTSATGQGLAFCPVHLPSASCGCWCSRSRPAVPGGQARCITWAPGQTWGTPVGPSVHSPVTEPGPIRGSFWFRFTLFWGGWPLFLLTDALGGNGGICRESRQLFAS